MVFPLFVLQATIAMGNSDIDNTESPPFYVAEAVLPDALLWINFLSSQKDNIEPAGSRKSLTN